MYLSTCAHECYCRSLAHGTARKLTSIVYLSLLLFLFFSNNTSSESNYSTELNFYHPISSHGDFIGPGQVTGFAQDGKGFIWVAGEAGVVRYNGTDFQYMLQDEFGNPNRAKIFDIKVDAKGDVWLAGDAGLLHYDVSAESFDDSWKYDSGLSAEVLERLDTAFTFAVDDDNIYFSDTERVWKIYLSKKTLKLIFDWETAGLKRSPVINHVFLDSRKQVWITTVNSGAYLFGDDGEELYHWDYDIVGNVKLMSIAEDEQSGIWLGTAGKGAIRIGRNFKVINYYGSDIVAGHDDVVVNSIALDKMGDVWLAHDKYGVSQYDFNTGEFVNYQHSLQDQKSLMPGSVQELFFDKSGGQWLGYFPYGVSHSPSGAIRAIRKQANHLELTALPHSGVLSLKSLGDEVLIGTEKGLALYDAKTDSLSLPSHQISYAGAPILSICQVSDDEYLLGTWGKGILQYSRSRHAVSELNIPIDQPFAALDIRLAKNGDIWIGSAYRGLGHYEASTKKTQYYTKSTNPSAPPDTYIAAIMLADEGVYFSTTSGIHYLPHGDNLYAPTTITGTFVNSISSYINQQYIITQGKGITLLDKDFIKVKELPLESGGKIANYSKAFLSPKNRLWVSTSKGVLIYDEHLNLLKHLTQADGLIGDLYDKANIVADNFGRIYLGSTNGLTILDETRLPTKSIAVTTQVLAVNSLYGSGKSKINFREDSAFVDVDPEAFSINFTALNLQGADITIEYRMLNYNDRWQDAQGAWSVGYQELPKGEYEFELRALYKGAEVDGSRQRLIVNVGEYFWQSPWGYTVYGLVLLVIIIAVLNVRWVTRERMRAVNSANEKTKVLATISHELKTPLTAAESIVELTLELDELPQDSRQALGEVLNNSHALLRVINNVLELTRIESGRLVLEKVDFSFNQIIEEIIDSESSHAQKHGVEVQVSRAHDLPRAFKGDPVRVKNLVHHLVNNAIKFTANGVVKISVQYKPAAGGAIAALSIVIEDNGRGIKSKDLKKIFSKFEQGSIANNREFGGTGLGLTIAQALVERMRGEIAVSSEEGVGTKVRITLPMAVGDITQIESKVMHCSSTASLNILCAEDFYSNQIAIKLVLNELGHSVDMVSNGQQALELLANEGTDTYDILMVDGRMPVMSGKETIKAIRGCTDSNGYCRYHQVPIIVLTADSLRQVERDYLAIGANAVLEKPIRRDELQRLLLKFQKLVPANARRQRLDLSALTSLLDCLIPLVEQGTSQDIIELLGKHLSPRELQNVKENVTSLRDTKELSVFYLQLINSIIKGSA